MINIECMLWGDSENAVLTWTRVHTRITRVQQHEPVASILNLRIGVVFVIVVGSPNLFVSYDAVCIFNQTSMRFLFGLCWFVFNETQIATVCDDGSSRRACESSHPNKTIIWLSATWPRGTMYMFCIFVVNCNGNAKPWFVIYKRFAAIYNQTHCILQKMVCKSQHVFCNSQVECAVFHMFYTIFVCIYNRTILQFTKPTIANYKTKRC